MESPEGRSGSDIALEPNYRKDVDTQYERSRQYLENSELERRIRWKYDLNIIPWIFVIWLFAFLDRSNLGNAYLAGLGEEVDLRGDRFNIALVVFHILYIVVDIPSNWLLKYVGGGKYLAVIAVAWGIIATCMGTIENYGGLLVCRLLLGACEGSWFGGIILYLSMFYKRHELMLRVGIFSSAASLSGAFGGLLATGLSQINYGGYRGWPWIFFVEGAVTVVLATVALFFLPNTPSSAKFLTSEEQWLAAHRLFVDAHGATSCERVEEEKFSWRAVRFAILNVNTLVMSLSAFLILIPTYSFSIFLPIIIEAMGYQATTAQLLSVPPNVLAFLFVILSALISDHIRMRGPLICVLFTLSAVGYIMELASSNTAVQYAGTFFIAAGTLPCAPLIFTWLSNNLASYFTRATGLGFITTIGQCGTFVATFTYLTRDAPQFVVGHSINLGAVVLTLLLVSANIAYIKWENAARQAGKRNWRYEAIARGEELGHWHTEFRYTL